MSSMNANLVKNPMIQGLSQQQISNGSNNFTYTEIRNNYTLGTNIQTDIMRNEKENEDNNTLRPNIQTNNIRSEIQDENIKAGRNIYTNTNETTRLTENNNK